MKFSLRFSKRTIYHIATQFFLIGILISFNNCSRSGYVNLASFPSDVPGTNSFSTSTAGTGIAAAYAPNCSPTVATDFIDAVSWDNRRVEPHDCALLHVTTPVFSWTLPLNIDVTNSMTLTIRRPLDNFIVTRNSVTPRMLLDVTLASGNYEWSVRYTNKSNIVVNSQVRRFTISNDSNLLALPSGAAFANIVMNKARPRALPSGSSFAIIASIAQTGEYKSSYTAFISKANALLTTAIATVPTNLTRSDFASDLDFNNWKLNLMQIAKAEVRAIETLGYAGRFTGNTAYDDAGMARVVSLAVWSPDGATSEINQDQANREIYLALAMGLDLFQNKLTSVQRLAIVTTLKNRLNQVMSKYSGFDRNPYDSHMMTATTYTTEALMYAVGTPEFPEAKDLLIKSWDTYATMLGCWGSTYDGGFSNGDAYGWYAMTTLARMVAAVKLISQVDLTKLPAVGNFGDNQIALTPAGKTLFGNFGDGIETNRNYLDYSYAEFRLYASVTGKPEHEWYWRVDPKNISIATALQPMHYLLLGIRTPVAPAVTPVLKNSWLFEDAGVVAMHSQTTDPLRSSLFFRSSRFGSYNHSHADNNAFTFVSKGKEILVSGGYYPYYNSPHHALVGRATRFKNTLTFDGGIGQAEPVENPTAPGAPVYSTEFRGRLINFSDNGTWAFTTGDATLAYRGRNPSTYLITPFLTNAIRSVAFNRQEHVAVIYDWATSATAKKWELNFHSLVQPTSNGGTIHILNGGVEACIDLYTPRGSVEFTSGFPIAPEVASPNEFHTRFSVETPSPQLVAVTVIREDCRPIPVSVNFAGTAVTIHINNGAAVVFDRKAIQN